MTNQLSASANGSPIFARAALVADSLSLGPHWIYNQAKITRSFPDGVFALTDPLANYHAGKTAGDLTHYGDQTRWLDDLVLREKTYTEESWKSHWLEKMKNYTGYQDGASKETLTSNGTSLSSSNDLAGASRIAPLFDLGLSLDDTIAAARSQTQLTHGDANVVDSAEFFVRAVFAISSGVGFSKAFTIAVSGDYTQLDPQPFLEQATNADSNNHLQVAAKTGLTCHFPEAFPLTLYYAIHHGENFKDCISMNALAGGDTSARAMLLAVLFAARDSDVGADLASDLKLTSSPDHAKIDLTPGSHNLQIDGPNGKLAGVLEIPETPSEITHCAIFAHCFTCGKDYLPEKRVTQALAKHGIATLRIDFAGIGKSEGQFEDSSFLTNIDDIYAAADWLRDHLTAPQLLVGHSLGGTAVLAAAGNIPEVQAVATIGSPADPAHILHMLDGHLDEIEREGKADVKLAGRKFTVSQKFVDDVRSYDYIATLNALDGHKLIMHSPTDEIVELKNAGQIYSQLQHPKSFIALADANHLLTTEADANYAAQMIAIWASKIICTE